MGQSMYVPNGTEIGFTGLVYSESSIFSLNETLVAGKVVLCFLETARLASLFVKEASGVGVIVANTDPNIFSDCLDDFPCIQVDFVLGTQILFYIGSQRSPTVKLNPTKTLVGKPVSTKVAHFSSRGPNSVAPAVLKPDIAVPGVHILAANSPRNPSTDSAYVFMSGTSMAAPHVAGVVALLKSLHPDWSPAAIKSALVTTASVLDPSREPIFANGDPQKLANAFDFGGGLVNPNEAANPGLVYDMGIPDYIHYLCSMGYYNDSSISHLVQSAVVCPTERPSILDVNLPSIKVPSLRDPIVITRTVTNVGPADSVYNAIIYPPFGVTVTVEPKVLYFNSATKSISFKVTLSTDHQVNNGYYFGSLIWIDGVHSVKSPVTVRTEIIESYYDDA